MVERNLWDEEANTVVLYLAASRSKSVLACSFKASIALEYGAT